MWFKVGWGSMRSASTFRVGVSAAQPEVDFGVNDADVLLSCWCLSMDKIFETALADAAYQREFERLQELVPALQNPPGTEDRRRPRSSKLERSRRVPSSRLFQPVLTDLDFPAWLEGAVQSRAFAERVRCA